MSGQSSNTSPTASAFYDPDSSSWRTSQGSLLSEEYPLLERLPDWATTADGALCVQATPGHLIAVRDGSASPPMLPTPAAWEGARGPDLARANRPNSGGRDLVTVTERLLPTPTARDYKDTGDLKKSVPDDDSLLPRALAHHVTGTDTPERSDAGN